MYYLYYRLSIDLCHFLPYFLVSGAPVRCGVTGLRSSAARGRLMRDGGDDQGARRRHVARVSARWRWGQACRLMRAQAHAGAAHPPPCARREDEERRAEVELHVVGEVPEVR